MDGTEVEILRDARHGPCMKQALLKLYEQKTLCDVTLTSSEGVELQAHWLVLSVHSDFLRHLAVSRSVMQFMMTESGSLKLNIEADILKTILDYLYSGDLVVTRQNLAKIKQAAKVLQLSRALILLDESHLFSLKDQSHDAVSTLLQPTALQSEPCSLQPVTVSADFKLSQPMTISAHNKSHQSLQTIGECPSVQNSELQPKILSVTSLDDNETEGAEGSSIRDHHQQEFCTDKGDTTLDHVAQNKDAGATESNEKFQTLAGLVNVSSVSPPVFHMLNKPGGEMHRSGISIEVGDISESVASPHSPASVHSHSDQEYEQPTVVDVLCVSRKRGRPSAPLTIHQRIEPSKKGRPSIPKIRSYFDGSTHPSRTDVPGGKSSSSVTSVEHNTTPEKSLVPEVEWQSHTSKIIDDHQHQQVESTVSNQTQTRLGSSEELESDNSFDLRDVKMEPFDEGEDLTDVKTELPPESHEVAVYMTKCFNDPTDTDVQNSSNMKRKRNDSDSGSMSPKLARPSSPTQQVNPLRTSTRVKKTPERLKTGVHREESQVRSSITSSSFSNVRASLIDMTNGNNSHLSIHPCDICNTSFVSVSKLLQHVRIKHKSKKTKTKPQKKFRVVAKTTVCKATIKGKKRIFSAGKSQSNKQTKGNSELQQCKGKSSSSNKKGRNSTVQHLCDICGKTYSSISSRNRHIKLNHRFHIMGQKNISTPGNGNEMIQDGSPREGQQGADQAPGTAENIQASSPPVLTHDCYLCGSTYNHKSEMIHHIAMNHNSSWKTPRFAKRSPLCTQQSGETEVSRGKKSNLGGENSGSQGGDELFTEGKVNSLKLKSNSKHKCSMCGKDYTQKCSLNRHLFDFHGITIPSSKPRKVVKHFVTKNIFASKSIQKKKASEKSSETLTGVASSTNKSSTVKSKMKFQKQASLKHKAKGQSERTCKFCSKSFSRPYSVQQHIQAVHRNKNNYVCVCKMGFKWSYKFSEHKKKCSALNK